MSNKKDGLLKICLFHVTLEMTSSLSHSHAHALVHTHALVHPHAIVHPHALVHTHALINPVLQASRLTLIYGST